ncbi:hypothetical protein KFU94_19700 [Chloroflexi bacterium TSY]|nr:hypothetical protein [Chloroflexi bacterium TSY]
MYYKKVILGALAYFISSFVIQGVLGFAIAGDYFSGISILRNPPTLYFALSQTIVAGIAFSLLYPITNFKGSPIVRGLKFGLLIGFIMVPFVAFDLPARFMIPSVGTWIMVQGILGTLHYAITGILIGFIYGQETNETELYQMGHYL